MLPARRWVSRCIPLGLGAVTALIKNRSFLVHYHLAVIKILIIATLSPRYLLGPASTGSGDPARSRCCFCRSSRASSTLHGGKSHPEPPAGSGGQGPQSVRRDVGRNSRSPRAVLGSWCPVTSHALKSKFTAAATRDGRGPIRQHEVSVSGHAAAISPSRGAAQGKPVPHPPAPLGYGNSTPSSRRMPGTTDASLINGSYYL